MSSSGIKETGKAEIKIRAEYLSFQQILCRLPVRVKSSMGYYVRVSNDGARTSEQMLFFPHDPACYTCDIQPSVSCSRNVRTIIEKVKVLRNRHFQLFRCLLAIVGQCREGQPGKDHPFYEITLIFFRKIVA